MPTAARASASGARSAGGAGRWASQEGLDLVAGVDAEELGDHAEQAGPLGPQVAQLGAGLGAALEGLEGEGGLEVLALGGGAGRVGGRGAAAAEHHVEVAAEAVLVEERPLGGVGRLEPLAGARRSPAGDR